MSHNKSQAVEPIQAVKPIPATRYYHLHKLVNGKIECGGTRKGPFSNAHLCYVLTLELTQMCIAIRAKPLEIPECPMMQLLKGWLELENSSFAFLKMTSSEEFASSPTPVCVRKSQTPFGEWRKEGLENDTVIDPESFYVFSNNPSSSSSVSSRMSTHTVIGSDNRNHWYVFECNHGQKVLRVFNRYETFFDLLVAILPTFEYLTNMYEAITMNENIANKYREDEVISHLNPIRTLYKNRGTAIQADAFFDILKELDGSRLLLRS